MRKVQLNLKDVAEVTITAQRIFSYSCPTCVPKGVRFCHRCERAFFAESHNWC